MRGAVFVDDADTFQNWLDAQPTFAQSSAKQSVSTASTLAVQGRQFAEEKGCLGCHSIDGSESTGPTWKGLYGKTEKLIDGTTIKVDAAYLKESILNPNASVVEGYSAMMPPYQLSDDEIDALIAFTESLTSSNLEAGNGGDLINQGQRLAEAQGCLGCHSLDGSSGAGPTWKGLFGKTETMTNNSTVLVDEAYLKDAIVNPNATVVKGFSPIMPPYPLNDEQLNAIIAYTKTIQ
jgi:cytochrome c oxidase subunit 2